MAKKEEAVNSTVRKVEVFYKYMETKDGKKFKKWLTKCQDGKCYDVKFCKEALANIPTARATLYVSEDCMNWSKKNPSYPVLWITKIEKVELKESAPEDFDIYFEKA